MHACIMAVSSSSRSVCVCVCVEVSFFQGLLACECGIWECPFRGCE